MNDTHECWTTLAALGTRILHTFVCVCFFNVDFYPIFFDIFVWFTCRD